MGADKIAIPNKYSTDEDWKKVYKQLGTPETGEGYKYKLPEDHKIEDDTLKSFSNEAVKLGLLPHQAQGIMKYYNDDYKLMKLLGICYPNNYLYPAKFAPKARFFLKAGTYDDFGILAGPMTTGTYDDLRSECNPGPSAWG